MRFIAIYHESEHGCGGRYTIEADSWNEALTIATREYGREPDALLPSLNDRQWEERTA